MKDFKTGEELGECLDAYSDIDIEKATEKLEFVIANGNKLFAVVEAKKLMDLIKNEAAQKCGFLSFFSSCGNTVFFYICFVKRRIVFET